MKITKENIQNSEHFYSSIEQLNSINYKIDKLGGYSAHNHHHILFVIKELLGKKCKNYLEIGTGSGSSILSVMKSKHKCNFYSIDTFRHSFVREPTSIHKIKSIIDKLNVNKHNVQLIKGNSKDNVKEIVENYIKKIKEGIGLFYIDGDHSYEYVLSDFIMYEPYVNTGGVIVFDDGGIAPVKRAINEIKELPIMENYIDIGFIDNSSYSLKEINKLKKNPYKYSRGGDDVINLLERESTNEVKVLKFTDIKDRNLGKRLKVVTKKIGAVLEKIPGGFQVGGTDTEGLTAVVEYIAPEESIMKSVTLERIEKCLNNWQYIMVKK